MEVAKLLRTVTLMAEVKGVCRYPLYPLKSSAEPPRPVDKLFSAESLTDIGIVVIGASSGGPPDATSDPDPFAPVLSRPLAVVQHTAAGFLPGMLNWLSKESRLRLKVARKGDIPAPGEVVFAPEHDRNAISANGT